MKALTLTQPWATLVVRGIKRYETRSWHYAYLDQLPMRLAIHASGGMDRDAREFADYLIRRGVLDCADPLDLPRGVIVGAVTYRDWRYSYDTNRTGTFTPSDLELELGDWSDGRILWRLTDPVELAEPIPARGAQRIWNWLRPEYEPDVAAMVGL